jgi:hypothetical protein
VNQCRASNCREETRCECVRLKEVSAPEEVRAESSDNRHPLVCMMIKCNASAGSEISRQSWLCHT